MWNFIISLQDLKLIGVVWIFQRGHFPELKRKRMRMNKDTFLPLVAWRAAWFNRIRVSSTSWGAKRSISNQVNLDFCITHAARARATFINPILQRTFWRGKWNYGCLISIKVLIINSANLIIALKRNFLLPREHTSPCWQYNFLQI